MGAAWGWRVSSIVTMSRLDAERTVFTERDAVVSIRTPCLPDSEPDMPRLSGYGAVLSLAFDDIGDDVLGQEAEYETCWGRPPVFLTLDVAREIVAFAREQVAAGRRLTVHCDAGISRSVGVAHVLARLLYDEDHPTSGGRRHGNALVIATMKRAAGIVPLGAEGEA